MTRMVPGSQQAGSATTKTRMTQQLVSFLSLLTLKSIADNWQPGLSLWCWRSRRRPAVSAATKTTTRTTGRQSHHHVVDGLVWLVASKQRRCTCKLAGLCRFYLGFVVDNVISRQIYDLGVIAVSQVHTIGMVLLIIRQLGNCKARQLGEYRDVKL